MLTSFAGLPSPRPTPTMVWMASAHHKRLDPRKKDIRLATVLLRTAIDSGHDALQEEDLTSACRHGLTMIRAYETALESTLDVSLTKRQCESIDHKSHEIEVLRPQLEARIVELNERQREASETGRRSPEGRHGAPPLVKLFLKHCADLRKRARIMRQMNAEVMHRASSRPLTFTHTARHAVSL